LNSKSILSVLLFLAVIAFSWFSYSVLTPASPMPLTSPTFELNSNTAPARQLYAKSASFVLSGTYVTQVQVVVYNARNAQQSAAITVQIYDWSGNLVSGGSASVTVQGRNIATASVNLSPSVPYSSVGRVVVNVA